MSSNTTLVKNLMAAQAAVSRAEEAAREARENRRLAQEALQQAAIPDGYYHVREWIDGAFVDCCVLIDCGCATITQLKSL